jgi:pimeloyl-ACP methyl ester carboxylesterase
LRKSKPPVLAIWGKNDASFLPAGALAFKRDVPNADVRLLDAGHFALETHSIEIAHAMRGFLARHLISRTNDGRHNVQGGAAQSQIRVR